MVVTGLFGDLHNQSRNSPIFLLLDIGAAHCPCDAYSPGSADPNVHRLFSWSLQFCTVSLGVAQHIAGNILHEIIYVVLADRGIVKSKLQDLWSVIVEGYRLDSATTRLGGLTLSMFKASSRPHQVFPLLKANAKETEWFCGL